MRASAWDVDQRFKERKYENNNVILTKAPSKIKQPARKYYVILRIVQFGENGRNFRNFRNIRKEKSGKLLIYRFYKIILSMAVLAKQAVLFWLQLAYSESQAKRKPKSELRKLYGPEKRYDTSTPPQLQLQEPPRTTRPLQNSILGT